MIVYYARVPEAAAKPYWDGHTYATIRLELYDLPGRVHVRESKRDRLMRVDHVQNGEAYITLGKAGDAIACCVNLPFSVTAVRLPD
jgi:hypothetical protein